MTRDEYRMKLEAMTARELDAEVAEKLFGYTWQTLDGDIVLCEPESDADYFRTYWPNRFREYHDPKLDMLPYSTDIGAAWNVVEKMMPLWNIDIEAVNRMYHISFDDYARTWEVHDEYAPRSICIAALLAVHGGGE